MRLTRLRGSVEDWIGPLGLSAVTAYFGLKDVGGLKPDDHVLVSAAAGGVGQMAVQIAHHEGCAVTGIAGGADKCRYLTEEIGYDVAVDRFAPDFLDQLAKALPNGADVYFDNVGGPLLASLVPFMARGSLVLICGLMSQYQGDEATAVDNLPAVLRAVTVPEKSAPMMPRPMSEAP